MSRVLALDYGRARCGCAISDPTGQLATPLSVIERPPTRRGLATLRSLIEEREVERVVVGLPLTLAGDEGSQADETRAFSAQLASLVRVPVELHDERLTTVQADRSGLAAGGTAPVDSRAAAHLLESYLAAGGRGAAPVDPRARK